jgi:hypothetical protein
VPGESAETALPIDDLAQLIRQMVQGSFPAMWIRGEVTQFTKHRNGHWYFTLKGRQSTIRCVMWATSTFRVPAAPDEGMTVCAFGSLDLFTGRTDLQFIVRTLEAQGEGRAQGVRQSARPPAPTVCSTNHGAVRCRSTRAALQSSRVRMARPSTTSYPSSGNAIAWSRSCSSPRSCREMTRLARSALRSSD